MHIWWICAILHENSEIIIHGSPVVSAMVVSSILDVSSKFWGSKKSQMRVYYCEMHGCKFNPLVCSIFGQSRCWSYIRAPVYIYSLLGLITRRQMKIEVLFMVAALATRVLGIIELPALWIPIRNERGLPSGVNKAASFLEWRLGGAQRQSGGSCLKESRARRRRHRDLSVCARE